MTFVCHRMMSAKEALRQTGQLGWPTAAGREQACGLAHRKQPLVLLVHEYKLLGDHLNAFFSVVKNHCPRKPGDHRYEGGAARWER